MFGLMAVAGDVASRNQWFVKIMLIFSMRTQTSQRAESQQGPAEPGNASPGRRRWQRHPKHGVQLGTHPWGSVGAGISQNSAEKAELPQPEPGVTPEVPLNNGSAAPSLQSWELPCSNL